MSVEPEIPSALWRRATLAQERRYREEVHDLDSACDGWRAAQLHRSGPFREGYDQTLAVCWAQLRVSALEPELRRGIFATPAVHLAVVRFGRGDAEGGAAALGMSLKVLAHREGAGLVTRQDFVLHGLDHAPAASVRDYTPQRLLDAARDAGEREPAQVRYASLFPHRHGPRQAVQLAIAPRESSAALSDLERGGSLVFDVLVQCQRDAEVDSIEDASRRWTGPWTVVGELHVGVADPADESPLREEKLLFDPRHSFADHEPLGRMQRLRTRLYAEHAFTGELRFPFVPDKQRVCVIGAGVSGMAAADALSHHGHEVVLVERAARVGGHSESVDHRAPLNTDPSFGSYTTATHPNLFALLDRLGLESVELTVFNEGGSWRTPDGRHAWTNTQDIPFCQHIFEEILRFNREDIPRVQRDPRFDSVSVGEFLAEAGYSREFVVYYFFGHAVYGFPGHAYERYLQMPVRLLLTYLFDFTVHGAQALYSIRGGTGAYAHAYARLLQETGVVDVRLGVRARVLSRDDQGVVVRLDGVEERFDQVVLSVQPHRALEVLGETATQEEAAVLGRFEHTVDTVYLHTDPAHMPEDRAHWRYLNIVVPDPEAIAEATHFVATKVMPSNHDDQTPVFMTFAHKQDFVPPAGATAITREHPHLSVETVELRRLLGALQGQQRTWYCGAYTRGLALHDDALVSGYHTANRILGPGQSVAIIERPALLESESTVPVDDDPITRASGSWASLRQHVEALASPRREMALELLDRLQEDAAPAGVAGDVAMSEASAIEAIREEIERVTKVRVTDPDGRLLEQVHTDSLGFIELAEALRRRLGVALPPSRLHADVSVRALAKEVVAQRAPEPSALPRGVVSLAEPPRATPLFLLPPLMLGVETFVGLSRDLGQERPVFGLPTPREQTDSEALARAHVRAIVASCPERVCFLGGYSHGGGIAHRVAELLSLEHGFSVPVVFMIDSYHARGFGEREVPASQLTEEQLQLLFVGAAASGLPEDWQSADPQRQRAWALEFFRRHVDADAGEAKLETFLEDKRLLLESQEAFQKAQAEPLLQLPELVYFQARDRDPTGSHAARWEEHFLMSTVEELPSDHSSIMRRGTAMAEVMREVMQGGATGALELYAQGDQDAVDERPSLHDLAATTLDGQWQPMQQYAGKVLLVVNVASQCSFTPQYDGLEALYREHADRGLVVLGFPSNEFGAQEPGSSRDIAGFCSTHHGVSFPMFSRVRTHGEHASPVYQYLTRSHPAPQWNFSKYLVNREGVVVAYFPSQVAPEAPELREAIESVLGS